MQCKILLNNYKQALCIIPSETKEVEELKTTLKISDEDLEGWYQDELNLFVDLKDKPEERRLEMMYVEMLHTRANAA